MDDFKAQRPRDGCPCCVNWARGGRKRCSSHAQSNRLKRRGLARETRREVERAITRPAS